MSTHPENVDPSEIEKFTAVAANWWSPEGEFKPLHRINPLRLAWIEEVSGSLKGKKVIDVGCGGGILSESLAAQGADVTGIDLAKKSLQIARLHSLESGIKVQYQAIAAEEMAALHAEQFDIVTCMEMLEHVPDPAQIIQACAQMLKPGGWLFCSTINRNRRSYFKAILAAEYIMGLVPKGTHQHSKFIQPSELANYLRQNHLALSAIKGLSYNPLSDTYFLTNDASVNYMLAARK
ncbi:bifunctional 2-polyprenyl-6-hydroxyphenol methylase/3-demethylubiquinol 3-O-methyltransferase UbiG [Brackiella oedipodis]|uniref:bifunctional 2-polyprenyl-6-hydroxyphenol methylase/3-demethylubiquinol 3-O-methyltransferase UbiG n=1 Tax=Brackiella oedipodis TaxID=124225 RepID=UPI00048CA66F|nr:bifunctional 2-polyprenyl-6-hydroxyphenol methylase/3-demethylubiquinol 3-O-methyltransferase UbiG [Brackiella oedipodis]